MLDKWVVNQGSWETTLLTHLLKNIQSLKTSLLKQSAIVHQWYNCKLPHPPNRWNNLIAIPSFPFLVHTFIKVSWINNFGSHLDAIYPSKTYLSRIRSLTHTIFWKILLLAFIFLDWKTLQLQHAYTYIITSRDYKK